MGSGKSTAIDKQNKRQLPPKQNAGPPNREGRCLAETSHQQTSRGPVLTCLQTKCKTARTSPRAVATPRRGHQKHWRSSRATARWQLGTLMVGGRGVTRNRHGNRPGTHQLTTAARANTPLPTAHSRTYENRQRHRPASLGQQWVERVRLRGSPPREGVCAGGVGGHCAMTRSSSSRLTFFSSSTCAQGARPFARRQKAPGVVFFSSSTYAQECNGLCAQAESSRVMFFSSSTCAQEWKGLCKQAASPWDGVC